MQNYIKRRGKKQKNPKKLEIASTTMWPANRGVDPGGRGPGPNIFLKGPCINRAPPIIKLQHVLPCQSVIKIMKCLYV